MPRTIHFHLDENAPDAVADGLRRLGIDVTTSGCRHNIRTIGQIIAGLGLIWEVYEADELANRVEYV